MGEWISETGDHIVVEETGLYIEGEYLADNPMRGTNND